MSQPTPKLNWKRRILVWLVITPVAIVVTYWVGIWMAQEHLIWPVKLIGPMTLVDPPASVDVLEREIGGGEKVVAWYQKPPDGIEAKDAPLLVYAHGNGELIDTQQRILWEYREMGCAVLLVEYRGYGRAGGRPSQVGIREDILAWLDRVEYQNLIYHGRSLGGGVAADLASVKRPDAMVLESTFSSIAAMAWGYYAPPVLLKHPYRTDKTVAASDWPIIFFHGTEDGIIPHAHGERLAKLRPGAELVLYACGHNDFPGVENESLFWGEVAGFLKDAGVVANREVLRQD